MSIHERLTASPEDRPADGPSVRYADARQVLKLILIGGLFLVAGFGLVSLSALNPSLIFAVFVFMSVVAPLLSAGALFAIERRGVLSRAMLANVLTAIEAFLVCLLLTLIVAVLASPFTAAKALPPWVSLLVFLANAAVAVLLLRHRGKAPTTRAADWLDALFVLSIAIAVFLLSPFAPAEPIPVGYLAYALDAPGFGYWAVFGAAWIAVGIWFLRVESRASARTQRTANRWAVIVAVLFIVSLYDDGHYIHIMSYEPLVDPAMHVLHGGVPMVDAYSQYGLLPWFVYYLAFEILPATFGTAAVVLRVINLAYFLVILAMIALVSKHRVSAAWFLIPAFLATITSHTPFHHQMWNVHGFPMMLGGRWLLPSGMALLLMAARGRPWAPWAALLLMSLAALSSMEILAFTLAPWGYCRLLDAIRLRSPGLLLRSVLLAILAIVVAQIFLAATVYAFTGQLIDYAPYISILRDYRPVEGNGWSMTFDPAMALWFPIAFSYFAVLAVASWRALCGEIRPSLIEQLVPVAVFALGPLAYFFGRPQEPALTISCLPFAVVAIGLSQVVFRDFGRFGTAGRALYATMAFGFAFTVADSFEHFTRPYNPTIANASILRRCFMQYGCWDALHNIHVALTSQALDPRTSVGQGLLAPSEFDTRQRIEELMSMLRRLSPTNRDVGMVTDFWDPFGGNAHAISVSAAMATGNWRSWFFTAPFHDGQAPVVAERVLRRVAATPAGTLIIVSNRREGLVELNQRILQALDAHCRLSPVETNKYHTAHRVIGCDGAKEGTEGPR